MVVLFAQLMRILQESIRLRRVLRGASSCHFRTSNFRSTGCDLYRLSNDARLGEASFRGFDV